MCSGYFRRFLLVLLMSAGAASNPLRAHSGEIPGQRASVSTPAPGQFLAIMGQVARPGVYELSATQTQLVEFVRMAGDLTAAASGSVRIVHHGRGGQQAFLRPELKYELVPGDLVIVDRKQTSENRRPTKSAHQGAIES